VGGGVGSVGKGIFEGEGTKMVGFTSDGEVEEGDMPGVEKGGEVVIVGTGAGGEAIQPAKTTVAVAKLRKTTVRHADLILSRFIEIPS
jgi:hypothetical protein